MRRKKTLTPQRAAELVRRAGSGASKAVLARDYGISRETETAYQYLRRRKADIEQCGTEAGEKNADHLARVDLKALQAGSHRFGAASDVGPALIS